MYWFLLVILVNFLFLFFWLEFGPDQCQLLVIIIWCILELPILNYPVDSLAFLEFKLWNAFDLLTNFVHNVKYWLLLLILFLGKVIRLISYKIVKQLINFRSLLDLVLDLEIKLHTFDIALLILWVYKRVYFLERLILVWACSSNLTVHIHNLFISLFYKNYNFYSTFF